MNIELILKIPKLCTPDEIIDCRTDSITDNVKESISDNTGEVVPKSYEICRQPTLAKTSLENSCNYKVSDEETGNNGQTINENDLITSSCDSVLAA